MSDSQPISAVVTTLSILEAMADYGEPIGVTELARLIDTNKPRTYRHLRTLVDQQYIAQDAATEKYCLTLKLFRLGQSVAASTTFMKEARRIMPQLMQKTGHSVSIGQVEDAGVRILDLIKPRSAIEIATPPGTLFEFHASAQGKIALAFGSADLMKAVSGKKKLKRYTRHTCVEPAALKSELTRVRARGWAVAPEEVLIGINALAAPIFGAHGELAGTITVVGSIQHLTAKPSVGVIAAVRDAAAGVSARLGYTEAIRA